MFHAQILGTDKEHNGYVLDDINIGGGFGDYIDLDYCLNCGQIQGEWPCRETQLEKNARSAKAT